MDIKEKLITFFKNNLALVSESTDMGNGLIMRRKFSEKYKEDSVKVTYPSLYIFGENDEIKYYRYSLEFGLIKAYITLKEAEELIKLKKEFDIKAKEKRDSERIKYNLECVARMSATNNNEV